MKTKVIKDYLKDIVILFFGVNLISFLFMAIMFYPGRLTLEQFTGWTKTQQFVLFFSIYCILFYQYFIRKILLKTKISFVVRNFILLIAGYYLIDGILQSLIISVRLHRISFGFGGYPVVFRWTIATVFALFYSLVKGILFLRIRTVETEKENIDASLQSLRAQIEPHFIFNTLNYVYALSLEEKAAKTSEAIEQLSTLFRYTLRESRVQLIPVEKELEFLEQYIFLNKIRVQESDNTNISSRIIWDKKSAVIAPLLAVNFIENAFKHGISVGNRSMIDILIRLQDNKFFMEVTNTIHGDPNKDRDTVGLENTRKRLDLLYKEKYNLTVKAGKTEYKVTLEITLNEGIAFLC